MSAGIVGPVLLEDAWDLAFIRVRLGLAIHPAQWVDEMIAERQAAMWEQFGPA